MESELLLVPSFLKSDLIFFYFFKGCVWFCCNVWFLGVEELEKRGGEEGVNVMAVITVNN